MIFLASLSCWIIFTLPLAFMQPPATSCMVRRNSTEWLEAPNPKTRIVKRSTSLEDFYRQNDEECLEVAENVVFERLRKDADLDPLTALRSQTRKEHESSKGNYESKDRFRRETRQGSITTEDSPVEDLKYKQLVFEENDPEAKTIDFETLQRKNRPADVLEYKRFLNVSFLLFLFSNVYFERGKEGTRLFQNQPLDEGKPPKKAYAHTKTRVKPPPSKVMVKRDANLKETWTENDSSVLEPRQQWSTMKKLRKMSLNEDEEEENESEEEVEPPMVRTKRYVRIPHSGQSPHTVSYAANYNEQENKGWVKPLFSSIVYRLPVRIQIESISLLSSFSNN